MNRPMTDDDFRFMKLALELAKKAELKDEVPVGALVVRNGEIIGRGMNASISDHDPTSHAEINAIRDAAKAIKNYRLKDCSIYVTLEPCAMCVGAIQHARIEKIIYGAPDPKTGACGSTVDLINIKEINHHAEAVGGILEKECGQILKDFFLSKRKKP
ncbi:MAG TPA: tRNA adenosine(34) deaminase TadA [Methylophilaceae bacterium]|nr:tRNA adenosine(34) deaminase TadA [Methylophilaceae bacterium]HAP05022.1 tRNA adenosine(34) deaminase TadA [Methylophilaceae bacterium]HBO18826.1 tRNA adenosine(34) deaminase TadA [Methylophilaceae bacterium]HCB68137.1 tRNA adenosine(34) deaminase TadA [Methylophilaceae bacterium]HCC72309.1 tRNA adenosine(34) deaminase TadA [Methylophilaceae bacterium]